MGETTMKKILITLTLMGLILSIGCKTTKDDEVYDDGSGLAKETQIPNYDEVIYDCGSHLVKGTEINISDWDLDNGVEVYYFYADDYSINHNYSMREWFGNFNAVVLNNDCKEILRFYDYTEIKQGGR